MEVKLDRTDKKSEETSGMGVIYIPVQVYFTHYWTA